MCQIAGLLSMNVCPAPPTSAFLMSKNQKIQVAPKQQLLWGGLKQTARGSPCFACRTLSRLWTLSSSRPSSPESNVQRHRVKAWGPFYGRVFTIETVGTGSVRNLLPGSLGSWGKERDKFQSCVLSSMCLGPLKYGWSALAWLT